MRFHRLRRSVLSTVCGAMAVVAGFRAPGRGVAATAPGGQVVVQPAKGNDLTQI